MCLRSPFPTRNPFIIVNFPLCIHCLAWIGCIPWLIVAFHIPYIGPSDGVYRHQRERRVVDCCILIYFITVFPINQSTINMMLGGGHPGSSEFVFTMICVCFVDLEVIPYSLWGPHLLASGAPRSSGAPRRSAKSAAGSSPYSFWIPMLLRRLRLRGGGGAWLDLWCFGWTF